MIGMTEWRGGEIPPVENDGVVRCLLRDGTASEFRARFFDWRWCDSKTDIIAYKLIRGGAALESWHHLPTIFITKPK